MANRWPINYWATTVTPYTGFGHQLIVDADVYCSKYLQKISLGRLLKIAKLPYTQSTPRQSMKDVYWNRESLAMLSKIWKYLFPPNCIYSVLCAHALCFALARSFGTPDARWWRSISRPPTLLCSWIRENSSTTETAGKLLFLLFWKFKQFAILVTYESVWV